MKQAPKHVAVQAKLREEGWNYFRTVTSVDYLPAGTIRRYTYHLRINGKIYERCAVAIGKTICSGRYQYQAQYIKSI